MFGRAGDLDRLNRDRHNPELPMIARQRADRAYKKIVEQMKDKKLMGMRERLINATVAGDKEAATKIQQQMRAYLGQDSEVGT